MKSRIAVIVLAVAIPLAVIGFVVVNRGGSGHRPARIPVVSGRSATTIAGETGDAALAPYGQVVYHAGPGLPTLDGRLHAYRVVPTGTDAVVRALADGLGIHGDPTTDDSGSIVITDGDAELSVTPNGSWGFTRQSAGGSVSGSASGTCAPDADCVVPDTTIPVDIPPFQPPTTAGTRVDRPTSDAARAIALAVMQRVGIDEHDATVTVDDGVTQWIVRADPTVDGIATEGFTTSVTVGAGGVVEYGNGYLGRAEAADEYPLIGTAAAIDHLNNGGGSFGAQPAWAHDLPLAASSASGGSGSAAPGNIASAEPSPPVTGTAVPPGTGTGEPPATDTVPPVTDTLPPPSRQDITLTGADRVLLFVTSYDGTENWLVPGYRFRTEQGDGPLALAIDDSFLTPPGSVKSVIPPEPPAPAAPNEPAVTPASASAPAPASDGGR